MRRLASLAPFVLIAVLAALAGCSTMFAGPNSSNMDHANCTNQERGKHSGASLECQGGQAP